MSKKSKTRRRPAARVPSAHVPASQKVVNHAPEDWKRELKASGEKCLQCGKNLHESFRLPLLVSPYGYVCGPRCAKSREKIERYLLDVVIWDQELTSKWLAGENFPEKSEKTIKKPKRRKLFSRGAKSSGPSSHLFECSNKERTSQC
jgi:hypothetical protein